MNKDQENGLKSELQEGKGFTIWIGLLAIFVIISTAVVLIKEFCI